VVIPKASKALFPDAPKITDPSGTVHSVIVGSLVRANNKNIDAHNEQIDSNLDLLSKEQSEAADRQNSANLTRWENCHADTLVTQEKPKKLLGIF